MASPTSSQSRAQLIREMSRDMNRTRNSSGSSRHSQGAASPEPTVSEFDPENEAIMSTRQLDSHSRQLPEHRASAQKYSPSYRPAEPDFAINTSAIGRAFPDFSQGGSSSDDDSVSIEIGRGVKKSSGGTIGKLGRSREHSSNVQLSLDDGDSVDFSAPMIGNYEVTATPPLRQQQASRNTENGTHGSLRRETKVRRPSGLQKEILDPSPPPAKTKDYGSSESRKGSGESRRTLTSMHARVRDENDQSRINDERPPTTDLTAKNTRFGNTRNLQPSSQGTLPTRFSSAQTLLNSVAPLNKQKLQTAATPNQGTQQSFMLPDLPNISELVSGVFEDGTPVFSRHGKPRASHFQSASQHNKSTGREYVGVHEIAVPDDEQAIFLSLKLLQDKVAILEKINAEGANTIDELQQRNQTLEEEKNSRRRARRGDSALGTTDSDGSHDIGSNQRKLLIEKNRLEASARSLQQQADVAQRKSSTAETILRQITHERDSAVSQLGVAYVTIEQLKVENESLKNENYELRARVNKPGNGHGDTSEHQTVTEKSSRHKLDQTAEASKTKSQHAKPQRHGLQDVPRSSSRAECRSNLEKQKVKTSTRKDADTMFDLSARQDVQYQEGKTSDDSGDSEYEAPQGKGNGISRTQTSRNIGNVQDDRTTQDLTYLSFLDSREIAQLRKTLELERIERKQRSSLGRHSSKTGPTVTQPGSVQPVTQSSQKAAPRKSSMKDLTGKSIQPETTATHHDIDQEVEHNRRHSEPSVLSIRSRRRAPDAQNMTSAFIVPDITIHNAGATNIHAPKFTEEAQDLVDSLTSHNEQNCTVCKRVGHGDEQHNHTERMKDTIRITKPTPVSERMPEAGEGEGDPTIRPAQAPGLALATVLKELEDELAHLKIQLSQYQALYNCHDPALSKRKRKSVQQKMESVLQAIDIKADQIYALYDVLEGQKQDGHEISDEEVEITLQSIGVEAPELRLRGGAGNDKQKEDDNGRKPTERHPWDLESDVSRSEELPWEGIESTVETTKSGFARAARRRDTGD